MKAHKIKGGDGLVLHVEEHGNPQGATILFIHGFNQCRLCWNKQVHSPLADNHRLITMDIRGHGLSEKPHDVYDLSKLWADDIAAVIAELDLKNPILSGWSYGGAIISNYLEHYGEDAIGGIHLVSAISKLGDTVTEYLGSDFVDLVPGMFSENAEECSTALQGFMHLCVAEEPSPEDFYFFMGYNAIVPPYVRIGLFSRTLDYDHMLPTLKKPVLLTHGVADEIVLVALAEHHKKLMPHAILSKHEGVGHAPFWEDAERFNTELAAFAKTV